MRAEQVGLALLQRLDPELAHDLALTLLGLTGGRAVGRRLLDRLWGDGEREAPGGHERWGAWFRNRILLAAGFDKNARALAVWPRLGFGGVEIGTVVPRPQPGNPRPRIFRLPAHRALINRMGFPSEGAAAVARRLASSLETDAALAPYPIGINIGKNRATPLEEAWKDYLAVASRLGPLATYLAINVSSPNTPGLRDLQGREPLRRLIAPIVDLGLRSRHGRPLPIFLKMSPDVEKEQVEGLVELVAEWGLEGIIATNTTTARPGLGGSPRAAQAGGLSGAPLAPRARSLLEQLAGSSPRPPVIMSVGGIDSAGEARRRRELGADYLQVYTAFVYEGSSLVGRLARAAALTRAESAGSAPGAPRAAAAPPG